MPEISVRVPGLLARFTDGRRDVPLRAETVAVAVEALFEAHPELEPLLVDGDGRLRPHVSIFHDGTEVEWPGGPAIDLAEGDEVVVLQAVSGG